MKTTVYLVRHAQSDNSVKDEMTRPLTPAGLEGRFKAVDFLSDKGVTDVYASPYLRAVTTVKPLADKLGLEVMTEAGFRERASGNTAGIADFAYKQWHDRDLAAEGGESLNMVRARFTQALEKLVAELPGHTIAIGTHGMALSTVYNHYDECFDYEAFLKVKDVMPRVVRLDFEEGKFAGACEFQL